MNYVHIVALLAVIQFIYFGNQTTLRRWRVPVMSTFSCTFRFMGEVVRRSALTLWARESD